MRNLKQELLENIEACGLNILYISLVHVDIDKSWKRQSNVIMEGPYNGDLSPLDFEYDEGYGFQEIFGTVYCEDINHRPVWLTREEYDGSEWFSVNTVPDFYFEQKK